MAALATNTNPKPQLHSALGLCLLAVLCLLIAPSTWAQEEGESAEKSSESKADTSNNIRWATAVELDNFGFDVFRGEQEEGPFIRLNEETIAGAGTTDEPSYYLFVDTTNDPHKVYYYYVESISMSNVREHFTPVFRARAKLPQESDEEQPTTPAPEQAETDSENREQGKS